MINLNVLNMHNFLQTVNKCSSAVNMIRPDGKKVNINKQLGIQNELLQQHSRNGGYTKLSMEIPGSKDYMSIILYYIGETG